MVCNAIRTVCDAYKVLKIKKTENVPQITFKQRSSVHFDKRTYSLKDGDSFSLYAFWTHFGSNDLGEFQQAYLKEAAKRSRIGLQKWAVVF